MKKVLMSFVIAMLATGLSACNDSNAEKVGENIDETLTEAENKLEDMCENAKEGMKLEDQEC